MTYNNGNEFLNELRDKWNRNFRSIRIGGIIASIFMIVIGVLCCIFPVRTTYFVEVLASVSLLLFGIWEIVRYVKKDPFLRTGVSLASGILNIIVAVLLLTSPAETMLLSFGFLFGLNLLMLGFDQITAAGSFSAVGAEGTGWLTANGIISVIVGILLLFSPVASMWAVSITLAVYLIFGGINLLVLCIKAKDLNN